MRGKFYGIGVGPGDKELITIKAVKTIEKCGLVVFPKSSGNKNSTAYEIAKQYINKDCELMELSFSMSKDIEERKKSRIEAVNKIAERLENGIDTAFLTLGDPTIFSTCMYALKGLKQIGFECELIPGVPSFCAVAARLLESLGEEESSFAVLSSSEDEKLMESVLNEFDSVVLMKASRNIVKIKEIIKNSGREMELRGISECGMPNEKIFKSMDEINQQSLSYFTTLLLKKGR